MNRLNQLRLLVGLVCVLLVSAALPGVFSLGAETPRMAAALDGREVVLYGSGPYENHSMLRATTYIGADAAMLAVVVPLLLFTAAGLRRRPKGLLVLCGALMIALYYAISQAFGAAFNRYFLLYTLLFALTGFTFGYAVLLSGKASWRKEGAGADGDRGTALFLFLAGLSALIWLAMILPATIQGNYAAFIDVNTTEPTFVLDIGVLFPLFTLCAMALRKGKAFAFRWTPILLTFYALVGVLVVLQSVVQVAAGLEMPLPEFLGLVVSFAVLGSIALALNLRFLRQRVGAPEDASVFHEERTTARWKNNQ